MFRYFIKKEKWLAALAAAMMLSVSACQTTQSEIQPSALPTVGVTVLVPTVQPTNTLQMQLSPTIQPALPVEEAPVPTESPTLFTQPVGIATQVDQSQPATPTVGGPLINRRVPTANPRAATMKITRPGSYSKVSSPIQLNALISPGDDRRVYVNLIGEDGRLIDSQILDFVNYDSRRFNITAEIPFEINSAAELARIEVYVVDQFDLKIQLISVDVLLIQYGDSEETPNEIELEPFIISTPGEGIVVTGGVLVVEGIARTITDGPLIVDLIDDRGGIVGSGETRVSPPSERSSHMPFQVIVPYTVDYRTRVRLTVRQESTNRIPGTVWLSSTVIFLDP